MFCREEAAGTEEQLMLCREEAAAAEKRFQAQILTVTKDFQEQVLTIKNDVWRLQRHFSVICRGEIITAIRLLL